MTIIAVSGHADLPSAPALRASLLAAFDDHDTVTLDLSSVTGADLGFLQLVEAGRREGAARGKTLALAAPATGVVRAALERSGFLGSSGCVVDDFWFGGVER